MKDLLLQWGVPAWTVLVITYLAHSTVWVGGGWLLGRAGLVTGARARNVMWRLALLTPLLSAPAQMVAGPTWTIRYLQPAAPLAPLSVAPLEASVPAPALANPGPIDEVERDTPLSLGQWGLLLAGLLVLARSGVVANRVRRFRRTLAGRRPVTDTRGLVLLGRLRRRGGRPADVALTTAEGLTGPVALWVNEICLQVGYTRLELAGLIRLRDHGVSSDFVRRMEARGIKNLSVDALIKLRNSGID